MASFPIYHPENYWKIYYEIFKNGKIFNSGTWWKSYKHKSSAVRAAKQQFDDRVDNSIDGEIVTYKWVVSQTKPE